MRGVVVGPAMHRKGMWVDILMETPVAKALICSWMYIRNVSDFQRPIFWMVVVLKHQSSKRMSGEQHEVYLLLCDAH